jgi:predicted CXXCH cytochrome family protein
MPQVTFAGWSDPVRRPRYILWTGAGVIIFALIMITALGVTSSRWFCSSACHKVQDDTIIAYNRSSHSQISCLACHEPVNASAVTFMIKKVEVLGELYKAVTDTYELPLNPNDEVAREMPAEQCNQCHNMERRMPTTSPGIKINHGVHMKNHVPCTECHNRVAHREDFQLTLSKDGKRNKKHTDYMRMAQCFRCHGSGVGKIATGRCSNCHPATFERKPQSHLEPGFYTPGGVSSGHWQLQQKDPKYCLMCHAEFFCTDCHGVPMPHPADFAKLHGQRAKARPEVCVKCHAKGGSAAAVGGAKVTGTEFCNGCHHKGMDPSIPWVQQHFNVVRKNGSAGCFQCHTPTFCALCHVASGVKG